MSGDEMWLSLTDISPTVGGEYGVQSFSLMAEPVEQPIPLVPTVGEDWTTNYDLVALVLPLLSVAFIDGPCPIPGHAGCTGRVLMDSKFGRWRHQCADGEGTRALVEVAASIAYGASKRLGRPSQAFWHRWVEWRMGWLAPLPVPLPPIPPTSRPALHVARNAVALIFGLKWLLSPGEESAIAVSFLAAVASGLAGDPLTIDPARDALRELEGPVLRVVRRTGVAADRSILYLPARGPNTEPNG